MVKELMLVLGGARSGKSAYAQQIAAVGSGRVLYVATAEGGDAEMARRISAHRASRPPVWQTLEAPLRVGKALQGRREDVDLILLDCLTLLASNVLTALPESALEDEAEAALDAEVDDLIEAYRCSAAGWIIVSNEVGLGLVPPYPLGRFYRDTLGRANQRLAALADRVVFMVAGIPMKVK
jgi:adenosylcobinamide kinase / adenosylcobinamide-phosphate guanylyltransferase